MKTFLDHALELARLGFSVFPVKAGKKKPPLFKSFWEVAMTDEAKICKLWKHDPITGSCASYNPAISTTLLAPGVYLIVLDVDPKHGGFDTLEEMRAIMGWALPETYEQKTPSGGLHLVYTSPFPCSISAGQLGAGLDIRAHHGYILGAGAKTANGVYSCTVRPLIQAPDWLLEFAKSHPPAKERIQAAAEIGTRPMDRNAALRSAHGFLASLPIAARGQRDHSAYAAACRLKDLGLSEEDAVEQMVLWFKFEGDFTSEETEHAVQSAYKYGQSEPGIRAPERHFTAAPSPSPSSVPDAPEVPPESSSGTPLHLLNHDHAVVMLGNKARILWESLDHKGKQKVEYLAKDDFLIQHAGETMPSDDGKKTLEVAKSWLRWDGRRSYDGVVFLPGSEVSKRFYNLWRGFSYEPLDRGMAPNKTMWNAVEMWKRHILENYCAGNEAHAKWLTGWFAHMVQRPQEKPLTALVLRGKKGNGKSAGVDRVGALFLPHYFAASDERYLIGNFNSYMKNTLMFALEEAAWAGNKRAQGVLQELVTRGDMPIEEKFREVYRADNFMRLVIISNEGWVVPASLRDERRWAVFDVEMRTHPFETPEHKRTVRKWFHDMRVGMEQGGYRYLLTYLQSFDLEDFDPNEAPLTEGLARQKEASLPPLLLWWLECLKDGRIIEGDFGNEWPVDPEKSRIKDAFTRYCNGRHVTGWLPSPNQIGRELHKVCPSMLLDKKKWVQEDQVWIYRFKDLETCRREWDEHFGQKTDWPAAEEQL